MAQFLAVAPKAHIGLLEEELNQKKFKISKVSSIGIFFTGNWDDCLRAHLTLLTATRILYPILDFNAYKEDELYNNTLKHDYTKYISLKQTIKVESRLTECSFTDNRYVSLKVKDAIVDQFRDKFGGRPNVSKEDADLKFVVKGIKNNYLIALDCTGGFISDRGYRTDQGVAPLKENIAASLLRYTGWTPDRALVDPMCGSGTFVIEAALLGQNRSPMLKKKFSFQDWKIHIGRDWQDTYEEVKKQENTVNLQLFGSDHNPRMIEVCNQNSVNAGFANKITFKQQSIEDFDMGEIPENGVIVVNPPYGERLGDVQRLKKTYNDLGNLFKKKFTGWDCYVLSGNPELSKELRLKSTRHLEVQNGPIKCRFLHYPMY